MGKERPGWEAITVTRVHIVCEGQTEETFVNDVLEPFLRPFGIWPIARLIGVAGHQGGRVNLARVEKDILGILKENRGAYCTTILDYYGLASGFPGKPAPTRSSTTQKATLLEKALGQTIAAKVDQAMRPDRFIPYVQMHEFEGLLFSDTAKFAKGLGREDLAASLQEIREAFPSPEDINDDPQTAPSKRILSLFPEYDKPVGGTLAAIEVGIDTIRKQCPRFNEWVTKLSQLGSAVR